MASGRSLFALVLLAAATSACAGLWGFNSLSSDDAPSGGADAGPATGVDGAPEAAPAADAGAPGPCVLDTAVIDNCVLR